MSNLNSDYTPKKQEDFKNILSLHMKVCSKIFDNPQIVNRTYYYLDVFAGPGKYNSCSDGSPLIFKNLIERYDLDYRADFFELDIDSAEILKERLGLVGNVSQGNSQNLIKKVHKSDTQYGMAYLDPFGEGLYEMSFNIMDFLACALPKVDIVLSIACTSIKRARGAGFTDEYIINMLNRIPKKHWIIRELYGKWHWTFLIGTNWPNWAEWANKGFYNLNSEDGREILRIANFSKKEDAEIDKLIEKRKRNGTNGSQLPLF